MDRLGSTPGTGRSWTCSLAANCRPLAVRLLHFFAIVGGLLLLVVSQTWLQEMIKVRLREWLTHDLLDNWLLPGHLQLLSNAGETGTNPDQYVQADAEQLAELSATLGSGLLQSTLLFGSFPTCRR